MRSFFQNAEHILAGSAEGVASLGATLVVAKNPLAFDGFSAALHAAIAEYIAIEKFLFEFEAANNEGDLSFHASFSILNSIFGLVDKIHLVNKFISIKHLASLYRVDSRFKLELDLCTKIRNQRAHSFDNVDNAQKKNVLEPTNGYFSYQITGFPHKQTSNEYWCRMASFGRSKGPVYVDFAARTCPRVEFSIDNVVLNSGSLFLNVSQIIYNLLNIWIGTVELLCKQVANGLLNNPVSELPPRPYLHVLARADLAPNNIEFTHDFYIRFEAAAENKLEVKFKENSAS